MNHYQLILDSNYILEIEVLTPKLRLVVLKNDLEIACRKDRISSLKKALNESNTTLYKGRVQVKIKSEVVQILFKKEVVGEIEKRRMLEMIS